MVRNHGLLTVADNVPDAFLFMYLFQAACTIQIRAAELFALQPPLGGPGAAGTRSVLLRWLTEFPIA